MFRYKLGNTVRCFAEGEGVAREEGAAGSGAGSAGAGSVDKGKGAEEESVILSPAQYNALLDRLDELEELNSASPGKNAKADDDLDAIVDEGKGKGPAGDQGLTEAQINKMTPAQLTSLILTSVEHMTTQSTQPLMVRLEEIRINSEIRELKKDSEVSKDFDSLKESIFKIAVRNPNLSIEEAYILAKGQKRGNKSNGEKEDKKDNGSEREDKDLLRNLPKRRVASGERPGAGVSGVEDRVPDTRVGAAKAALETMRRAGQL